MMYDNESPDRIIIFAPEECFRQLDESNHWYMDGTYINNIICCCSFISAEALIDLSTELIRKEDS